MKKAFCCPNCGVFPRGWEYVKRADRPKWYETSNPRTFCPSCGVEVAHSGKFYFWMYLSLIVFGVFIGVLLLNHEMKGGYTFPILVSGAIGITFCWLMAFINSALKIK